MTNRRVDLGVQPAGTHTWTWNGHNQSGKVVSDQAYVIRLFDADPAAGSATSRASEKVQVDTGSPRRWRSPPSGAEPGAPARVLPADDGRHRHLPISADVWDNKVDSFELVIRNARGRVVRRADVDERDMGS